MRHLVFALGVLAAAASFACTNNNSNNSAITGPTPTVVTETFSGSLGQNGTYIHNFTVNTSGYTLVAGFTSISPSTVTALGLGIATWHPDTQTCDLNQSQSDHAPVGSTAVTGTAGSGSFCVRVYDGANISDPSVTVSYTVQIQHY